MVASDDWPDIEATLNGDGDAYARLIERYQARIGARMWHFTRDRGHTEELVQDVFVAAYTSLPRFKGQAPFEHWLNRIATRVGYAYWRKRDRLNAQGTVNSSYDFVDTAAAPDAPNNGMTPQRAADLVHGQLAQLPPRDRLVLTLMYLEGSSVKQTAAATGWSASMVKVQAFRPRKKLKRLLEQEMPRD